MNPSLRLDLPEAEKYLFDPELALSSLDPSVPGWVPTWYPHMDDLGQMNPEERARAFHKHLEASLPAGSTPSDSPSTKKRAAALSLLHLHWSLQNEALPTPDRS